MTTHRERIQAAIKGEMIDRPPVALWRHFPVDDQVPQALADAHLNYQQNYDFDLVKVTPASSFCIIDWGVKDAWVGDTEGTRRYTERIISDPRDWEARYREGVALRGTAPSLPLRYAAAGVMSGAQAALAGAGGGGSPG